MFDKAKGFVAKKMMERQLKDAPKEQREMMMTVMENDPELLEKIAKEIKSEMAAAMKIMPKYQAELQKAMGPAHGMQRGGARFNPNGSIRN